MPTRWLFAMAAPGRQRSSWSKGTSSGGWTRIPALATWVNSLTRGMFTCQGPLIHDHGMNMGGYTIYCMGSRSVFYILYIYSASVNDMFPLKVSPNEFATHVDSHASICMPYWPLSFLLDSQIQIVVGLYPGIPTVVDDHLISTGNIWYFWASCSSHGMVQNGFAATVD